MKLSSRQIGKIWRDFERNAQIGRYASMAAPVAAAAFVGYFAIFKPVMNTFFPEPASGCFNNAADDGAIYLTYAKEGSVPQKATDSWKVSVDGKTCHTDNPFVPVDSVPVVPAP